MYRVYELTDREKNKITKLRWDGDTHYYDVFESQEECDKDYGIPIKDIKIVLDFDR